MLTLLDLKIKQRSITVKMYFGERLGTRQETVEFFMPSLVHTVGLRGK